MKLGENGCFGPLPAELSTQPNWFLVCILTWWVFRKNSIFFLLHRPNLAPLVAINVFPFSLIRPQVGTFILWCLVYLDCFMVQTVARSPFSTPLQILIYLNCFMVLTAPQSQNLCTYIVLSPCGCGDLSVRLGSRIGPHRHRVVVEVHWCGAQGWRSISWVVVTFNHVGESF